MSDIYNIFPIIKETEIKLEQQRNFLNKVILTGKINVLDLSSNLFEMAESTSKNFEIIKNNMIKLLIKENLNKLKNELHSKAQVAIDILIRNLFERTADVGFLSTDEQIVEFLTTKNIKIETIKNRLEEYVKKYSVYNEVIIFDTQGKCKANLNTKNPITHTKDTVIKKALESDSYIEFFRKTDIFPSQKSTLVYAQRIRKGKENIGVLCLCFKFDDEMNRIFKGLKKGDEHIYLYGNNGVIAKSSTLNNIKNITYTNDKTHTIEKNQFFVSAKTKGYQGYYGQSDWFCTASHPPVVDKNQKKDSKENNLVNEALLNIINETEDIVCDLSDIIINGELIASKNKTYVLNPILDNLRDISQSILFSIKETIYNLETVVESIIYDAKIGAQLAMGIMDRNLYERANDCRWWALTPSFIQELSKDKPNNTLLHTILLAINELYTVYTNLFIYNNNGEIIATSRDSTVIGTILKNEATRQTLHNTVTQNYFVTDFEESPLYDDNPTYIYNASITKNDSVLGGIGIVFDSSIELKAILEDAIPTGRKGFALFIDKNQKILASTNNHYKVLSFFELDEKFFNLKNGESNSHFITLNDKKYVLGTFCSKGYREYKTTDNYTNEIISFMFLEL